MLFRRIFKVAIVFLGVAGIFSIFLLLQSQSPNQFSYHHIFFFAVLTATTHSFYSLFTYWLSRERNFRNLAARGPAQSFSIATIQSSLGAIGLKQVGLMIGEVIGRSLVIVFNLFLRRDLWLRIKSNVLPGMKFRDYQEVPILRNMMATVLDNLCGNFIILFLAFQFSAEIVGEVSMAQRIATVPVVIFGTVLSQYILSTFSHDRRNQNLLNQKSFDTVLIRLITISFFFAILITMLAPFAVQKFFPADWSGSSNYMAPLALIVVSGLTWGPISSLFYAMGLHLKFFIFTSSRLLSLSIVATFLTLLNTQALLALTLLVVTNLIVQALGILWLRSHFPSKIKQL